jgi:hypothetical protein
MGPLTVRPFCMRTGAVNSVSADTFKSPLIFTGPLKLPRRSPTGLNPNSCRAKTGDAHTAVVMSAKYSACFWDC